MLPFGSEKARFANDFCAIAYSLSSFLQGRLCRFIRRWFSNVNKCSITELLEVVA